MPSIPRALSVRRVFVGNRHQPLRCGHFIKVKSLLVCLIACLFVAADLRGQRAEIVETLIIKDEFGSGGWLALKLRLLPNQFAQIEASEDLIKWRTLGEPILSFADSLELHVPMEERFGAQFFRVVTRPAPVSLKQEDGLQFAVDQPIAVNDALGFLSAQLGTDLFLADAMDGQQQLQPGQYEAAHLDELLGKFDVRVWAPAFPKDDPALADLFPDTPRRQTGGLPDNEPGEGRIEDGWRGDSIQVRPLPIETDPPIDPNADMPFILDIRELPPGTPPEPIPGFREPGTHLQVVIEFRRDGTFEPKWAYEAEGDARPDDPFLIPELGSTIWVVRSALGAPNEPGHILYIGSGPDPFVARSYDPPFRGSHGNHEMDGAILRLAVPVPVSREGKPVLDGLTLEVFRYQQLAAMDFLTPELFLRNEQSFEPMARMDEMALRELLEKTQREEEVQAQSHNSTVTQLHRSGPRSEKFNFVIIGDGFQNTTSDQNAFNNYVQNVVMDQLFSQDIHPEILNAMNVFRINTFSQDSGVTRVNSSGNVTIARNTALMFRYSGNWNRCWMELTPFSLIPLEFGSEIRLAIEINHHVPEANMIAVVLNEPGQGGCARSSHFAVTLGAGWGTFAHEFGHNPGGLGDEYQCNQGTAGCGSYSGSQPGAPNLDNTTSRSSVKWSQWIPSWRPVPTAMANIASTTQDVGIFPGATMGSGQWWTGIYRPSWRGRMNDNNPVHNPPGYTRVRDNFRPRQEGDFRKSTVGDFNGDGLQDLVMLDDRQLSLHLAALRNVGANDPVKGSPPRSETAVLEPTWFNTGPLPNTAGNWLWITRKNDIIRAGDFDGDGLDDLYVANLVDWSQPYLCMLKSFGDRFEPVHIYAKNLPGWTMTAGDEFYVADVDGDGRKDLLVYNGENWIVPYFLMVRSTGGAVQYVRRYDQYLPNWEMGRNETFHIGDFDGNGREDLAVIDTQSWAQVHLRTYAAVAGGLALRARHYGTIPTAGGGNFWQMRRKDRLNALDYDGDDTTDLAIFNGFDWGPVYLGLMRGVNGAIVPQRRYDNSQNHLPGWEMRRRDSFHVANVNGDARQDLVVYNSENWSTQYLGILRSLGEGALQGTWQDDWIGGWNLGSADDFHVADFRGAAGWDDLFVFNKNWLGLLRSHSNHYKLEAIYNKWIHNHRWHPSGLW